MTTPHTKIRANKRELERQRVILDQLTLEKQELEAALFESYNEVHRLSTIVKEQEKQLLGNSAVQIDEPNSKNKYQPKRTKDMTNIKSNSSLKCKRKTQCQMSTVKTKINAVFQCKKCKYSAKRKYTLKVHEKLHCSKTVQNVVKDEKCRICHKFYTHNGLRSHLLGFANAQSKGRKPRGLHGPPTTAQDHFNYLNEINLKNSS